MKNTCVRHDIGSDFHAGHFLRDLLHEQGHDTVWLAAQTGMDQKALETLLNQSNMDTRLFVEVGERMQPLFFQRVEEMIFGQQPMETINQITREYKY